MTYNIDFPIDELPLNVRDRLLCIADYDEENNPYIHTDRFKEYAEDLKVEDIDLLCDIQNSLGDVYNRLITGNITTLTLLDDIYSQACM